jgi:hypothetical protein
MCVMCQSGPEVVAGVSGAGLAVPRIRARLSVALTRRRRFRVEGDGRTV